MLVESGTESYARSLVFAAVRSDAPLPSNM